MLDSLHTLEVVRRKTFVSRWGTGAVLVAVVGWLAVTVVTSPNLDWVVVGEYFLSTPIIEGIGTTLLLTFATLGIGLVLGAALAMMRQSRNPVAGAAAAGYIWFFRGVPLVVQIVFWFNLALLFPTLGFAETNAVITPLLAAMLGLGLHEAAYLAEIIRGGFLAVPRGQVDAALTIGMTRAQATRVIVLPQSVRVILPALGNQFILILKGTSLVSVIGGGDLMTRAQQVYGQNYQVIALLLVATGWYLILVTIAGIGQRFLERWAAA
ncbi:amino acid ABC transporter permease [Actinokineospora diospyrosa]|uniref:Polar amino acid transport system permease protein n=1 Tax=Actinokineospora diospyrosa TaxID=103728 RepID=A0ABT1IEF3_9PSEU|nr:amino acid ABC transporter permease [Actinokineospora diospyrosa]MCP2271012.1 polar amino acid transport system permease protein [Actinokineospora diospyrosa]